MIELQKEFSDALKGMIDNFGYRDDQSSSSSHISQQASEKSLTTITSVPSSFRNNGLPQLKTRYSDHLVSSVNLKKDCFYPPVKELGYDNFIVGFVHKLKEDGNYHGFNVLMSNGKRSTLAPFKNEEDGWEEVKLSIETCFENPLRRITIWGNQYSTISMV